jgi:tRNA threonylcarbamoyladenosine biosynthesis protein TsaB
VAIGPGSYTGLRIGLGFAKGLALANQTKLIGVPTLDILAASQPRSEGQLVAIAEAGRSRVSAAIYAWQASKGWQIEREPDLYSWPELLDTIETPSVFSGEVSPAGAKLVRGAKKKHKIATTPIAVRRAGYLADIGWQRLRRGWISDPAELAPLYLRDPAGARP